MANRREYGDLSDASPRQLVSRGHDTYSVGWAAGEYRPGPDGVNRWSLRKDRSLPPRWPSSDRANPSPGVGAQMDAKVAKRGRMQDTPPTLEQGAHADAGGEETGVAHKGVVVERG